MQVKIKRVDTTLPLPKYETAGAVAFDFVVREITVIPAKGYGRAPSNVIIDIPEGYMVWITDRSSTLKKTGLLITEGIVDQDFCGDDDEILLQFYNPGDHDITLRKGDRVAQGIFLPIEKASWSEVGQMSRPNRGGFGSTETDQRPVATDIRAHKQQQNPLPSGKLIVIDGIDGSGKTTQLAKLVERLKELGYDVVTADFPQYGNKSAGMVENYLNGKYGEADEVSPYVSSLFYMMDRYDASFRIKQWLDEGKIVVTNRYTSANMGHQGAKFDSDDTRAAFFEWNETYEHRVFDIPRPDLTVVLHVDPDVAQRLSNIERKSVYMEKGGQDIHEANLDHLKSASESYKHMCATFHNFELIDCTRDGALLPVDAVGELVWNTVEPMLLF